MSGGLPPDEAIRGSSRSSTALDPAPMARVDPEQSLAAADHSAFSAMEQHKPELNRKSRVDRCLQLCFISNSKLSWGGDIGNDDQNRAFEQAGFGVL
jgi:hypothetical protein